MQTPALRQTYPTVPATFAAPVVLKSKNASVVLCEDELVRLMDVLAEVDLSIIPSDVALRLAKQLFEQAV